jgi:hypothetical protein
VAVKEKKPRKPLPHAFKPGNCANPLGRKAHNSDTARIRGLTAREIVEVGSTLLNGNVTDLVKITGDKKTPPDPNASALKVWIARVAVKGITRGDGSALDLLLNRIVGKVPNAVEVSGKDGGPVRQYMDLSPEARAAVLADLSKRLDEDPEDPS